MRAGCGLLVSIFPIGSPWSLTRSSASSLTLAVRRSSEQEVCFAGFGALDERGDLVVRVDERRTVRVGRLAQRHPPVVQSLRLDPGAAVPAAPWLPPAVRPELGGRHPVVDTVVRGLVKVFVRVNAAVYVVHAVIGDAIHGSDLLAHAIKDGL